ncbi:MAG: TonB-dependent receptor plug domain-containing protein [Burkholderiales bacterium]|nr:TonB-dependent receptor plug domain-containing protein [Burkholderiales bacterium]MDR4517512.1 TonB-dependent receptor plug domain-containing protein [Nitrosomonas sp.]
MKLSDWGFSFFFVIFSFSHNTYSQSVKGKVDPKTLSLLEADLAALAKFRYEKVGSLTLTAKNKTPAAVTRIDHRDIQAIGARSLNELLEIIVPGLQSINHHWELPHIGIRGITSDREDKVLIRVNGRTMNERTARGAITERDFPFMGDIKHIDVIRGAGSPIFGLGAVSMVIDITTHDANSVKGKGAGFRVGQGSDFKAAEAFFSKQLDNGLGIYMYGEAADMVGASNKDAPLAFGADATSFATGDFVPRDNPFPTRVRDGQGFRGKANLKGHLNLNYKDTKFWLRYNRAGRTFPLPLPWQSEPAFLPNLAEERITEVGYEQFTATLEHDYSWHNDWNVNFMLSYDTTKIFKSVLNPAEPPNKYRENELFARMTANWSANEKSDIALGSAISYEIYGVDNIRNEPWDTVTWSVFGEWQWRPHKYFTTFLGGRVDQNTYTGALFSPRASLVYHPDNKNTFKLLYAVSQRMNIAQDNREAALNNFSQSKPEKLNSVEGRYEYKNNGLFTGISLFYIDLDAIGWDDTIRRTEVLGNQEQWGSELEIDKSFGDHRVRFSYAYTKLIDFDLFDQSTFITARPFGFGSDLANWATHSGKFWYSWNLTDRTRFDTTLRAFWGYDGSKDFRNKLVADGRDIITADWKKPFKEQIYLNFALQHNVTRSTRLSLNFYNVLGWFDQDLNKRLFREPTGGYRLEAATVAGGITIQF